MRAKFLAVVCGLLALPPSVFTLQAQTNLANALDATNLVWTTGGTGGVGWFYDPQDPWGGDNTFDGIAAARSGQIGDNSENWIQTTVVGPGTVSFWWNAYSEPNADFLEFYVDADMLDRISGVDPDYPGPSGWQYREFPVPAGTNNLKWRYVRDLATTGATLNYVSVDRVQFVTTPPPALDVALNTCGVTWTSGGNTNSTYWFGHTNVTHDGMCAAQSGAIWHNQTNWLETSVTGVTNVSFWWKVSSETNADLLEFYTNGVLAKRISGEVAWQSNYFKLSASKTNTLRWLYRRNAMFTQGANCGWLDQVAFNPPFKPSVASYATNLVLSTTSSNCQAVLPDFAGAGLFVLEANCSSATITQAPPAGTALPIGTTRVTITATIAAGGSVVVTNTTMVVDSVPPMLSLPGDNPLTNECRAAFVDPGMTASDLCSGIATLTTNSTVNPNQVGVYSIQYIAVDGSGNAATNTRTVYVVDTRPPTVAYGGANPLTLAAGTNCTALLPDLTPLVQATDASSPALNMVQIPAAGTALPLGSTNVVFRVDDGNGNTNTCATALTVTDQTPPAITTPPLSQTNRIGTPVLLSVVATACSGINYQWYFQGTPLAGGTDATYAVPAARSIDAGEYFAVVTSSGGSRTSSVATLTILSDPAVITGAQMTAGGGFQLSFSGPSGQTYTLLAGDDVSLPRMTWTALTNGTFGAGHEVFIDTSATSRSRRFYQIVSP